MLDTGAVSRGSGSKSSNKERDIRRALVEADLIEGVVLLPENLFYNTSAPGIVLLLNRAKPAERRGQFLLVNASQYFVKEKPKNVLTDAGIAAVAEVYRAWETREKLSRVVTLDEVRAADYNLSPSQFVEVNDAVQHRPLADILVGLGVGSGRAGACGCSTGDGAGEARPHHLETYLLKPRKCAVVRQSAPIEHAVALPGQLEAAATLYSADALPVGWRVARLGDDDVASTTSGGTPSRSNPEYFRGNIPWVKSGELDDNWIYDTEETISEQAIHDSSAKVFPEGTLLIAMYGATAGKTGLLATPAATNQAVCAVFPQPGVLESQYLQYYVVRVRPQLLSARSGGAQPNISQRILSALVVSFPPLLEQRAIAQALRTVQDAIQARRRELELERERKAALMQHLFTHGTRGEPTKVTEIGEIPVSWEIETLENLCKVVRGSSPRPKGDPRYYGGSVPRLMIADVTRDGMYVTPRIDFLTHAGAELSRRMIKGDLILSISGTVGLRVDSRRPCGRGASIAHLVGWCPVVGSA